VFQGHRERPAAPCESPPNRRTAVMVLCLVMVGVGLSLLAAQGTVPANGGTLGH